MSLKVCVSPVHFSPVLTRREGAKLRRLEIPLKPPNIVVVKNGDTLSDQRRRRRSAQRNAPYFAPACLPVCPLVPGVVLIPLRIATKLSITKSESIIAN